MPTTRRLPTPLRIGVLGGASIARQFVRDLAGSRMAVVTAVASRTPERAAAFAAETGLARSHGRYEDLLQDPEIDIVYLPLPNSLHAEWAIRAAEHGKHVLCEKPLAIDAAQARAMFEAARRHGVMLLEAYPYWFQPQTGALVDLLASGTIGAVKSIQACFGFTLRDGATNIRMKPELGGGALLDAGSYPLSLIRLVMGVAPVRVSADATWSASGVDLSTMATLHYADGRRAQLSCAMDTATHRRAVIVGTAGTIETEYLNHTADRPSRHPFGYQASDFRVRRGVANTVRYEPVRAGAGSGFRFAAEAFVRVLRENDVAAVERAAQASLDSAATLEAIALSARTGAPAAVGAA